jgi:hypothetical protein
MLKRSDIKANAEKFVENAKDEVEIIEDLHKFVRPTDWPISPEIVSPSLADGNTTLNKNLTINLKEIEWNSIDRHVKALNVSKAKWIRYALLQLMQEEQLYFLKNKKDK